MCFPLLVEVISNIKARDIRGVNEFSNKLVKSFID